MLAPIVHVDLDLALAFSVGGGRGSRAAVQDRLELASIEVVTGVGGTLVAVAAGRTRGY